MELRDKNIDLKRLANDYSYRLDDEPIIEIGERVREKGYYSRSDFLTLCNWKTERSKTRCEKNEASEVEEITRFALSAKSERARITSLLGLEGVSWPTASVLLHYGHSDRYPILDFRALWSLGVDKVPHYNFAFWMEYVNKCRELTSVNGMTMRELDRALWQYSKENPPENNK